jgi:phosphoribosylformylglycinamidine cyclo-ligase
VISYEWKGKNKMINYKDAGVDIHEGYKTVDLIKGYAAKTMIPGVINNLGSFAGMVELTGYEKPVLVSGTDGVGTKLEIAFRTEKYDTVGIDCVAMCVNDILCHGAKPLFFLDYLACGKLEAEVAADIVKGVAEGCIQSGCALIGGETAEMPGFYKEGEYDIAGFAVGIVEKDKIIDGSKIKDGDILIGIESSGIHSNGYSLVRKLIPDLEMDFNGKKMGEVLLTPTKIYVKTILKLIEKFEIKGMAHITGGGFIENIPRMFKGELTAVIEKNNLRIPEIFKYMMSLGVEESHMFNTYNMGVGFVLCVDKEIAEAVVKEIISEGDRAYVIGHVEAGGAGVCLK